MLRLFISFLIVIFFQACVEQKKVTIKIGISPWPGYEPLILALEHEFYDDLDVRIVRFATPSESFRALRNNVVDVVALTADEVLHYADIKNKPKMFLVLDVSNGGDAIVARENIKSLNDLKGKKVCVEPSALGNYVIHRAMDFTDNLQVSDLNLSSVDIGNHVEYYKKELVDVVVTYEPFRSLLLNEGAHIIFDSKKIPNEIIDVLVAEDDTLGKYPDELKKLVNGWFKAIEYIKNNKKEAMTQMASYEYISAKDFEKSSQELVIPSREQNIQMLGNSKNSYKNSLNRLSSLMYEKGVISKKITGSNLMTDSIVKSVKE